MQWLSDADGLESRWLQRVWVCAQGCVLIRTGLSVLLASGCLLEKGLQFY